MNREMSAEYEQVNEIEEWLVERISIHVDFVAALLVCILLWISKLQMWRKTLIHLVEINNQLKPWFGLVWFGFYTNPLELNGCFHFHMTPCFSRFLFHELSIIMIKFFSRNNIYMVVKMMLLWLSCGMLGIINSVHCFNITFRFFPPKPLKQGTSSASVFGLKFLSNNSCRTVKFKGKWIVFSSRKASVSLFIS